MPNLDYYNTARMHQMVNSFQDIYICACLSVCVALIASKLQPVIVNRSREPTPRSRRRESFAPSLLVRD